jgi:hypothetical protein
VLTVVAVALGAAPVHHLNVHAADHVGIVYIFAHVNVVPLVTIYVPLLTVA